MNRAIKFISGGQRADIGEMIIYRLIPNRAVQTVGPFVFLDYISRVYYKPRVPQKPAGKGAHPHRGICTFTYLLQGEFEHYDSRGHYGVVGDGGAQWMKAGNGVIHDEYFSQRFQQQGGPLLGHQFWINLPSSVKQEAPDYQAVPNEAFPQTRLPDGAGFFKVVIGTFAGQTSPVKTYSKQFLYHIHLQPGKAFALETQPDLEYAALLSSGDSTLNDTPSKEGNLLVFGQEGATIALENKSDTVADILIFGGEPYREPILSQGPFVMNSGEEITQAYQEYRAGKYGSIDYSNVQTIAEF